MNIVALGYLGFESPNAKAWESFGPEVFGFGLAEAGADGSVYLRMDSRHHRIAIHPGATDRIAYVGLELRDSEAFLAAVGELRVAGLTPELGYKEECRIRRVQAFARFRDPADYVHEVFFGASSSEPRELRPSLTGHKILWFLSSHPAIKNFVPCCGERVANPRPLVDVGSLRRRRVCKFDGPPPPVAMHRCNRGTSALFVTSTISQ